jgi:hypothetical protein
LQSFALVRRNSLAVTVVIAVSLVGCTPDATEIVVRDPFAVSVSQLEGRSRTQMVPTQSPPTESEDKIDRAIDASHFLGPSWSFHFDSAGSHHWTAWRYHRGGISLWNHDYGSAKLLDDEGIVAIGSADGHAVTITYDPSTCELVITSHQHTPTRRHGGSAAHLDYELRTPLSNIRQIRSIKSSAFTDRRDTKVLYP